MTNNVCPRCKIRPKKKHLNSKWCKHCALALIKQPKSTLTREQIREAKSLIRKMPRDEIALELGVSLSNLKRAFRGTRICFFNKHVANPKRTRQVCDYYAQHGMIKTEQRFPDIRVRSVIERYPHKMRQERWTEKNLIDAVKMAGLTSVQYQARYFNRPNAHAGSIRSLWNKRFGHGAGSVHGLSTCIGRELVTQNCPLTTTHWQQTRRYRQNFSRKIYLWIDMRNHLKPGVPSYLRDAIFQMAKFQIWLFAPQNPKKAILKLIEKSRLDRSPSMRPSAKSRESFFKRAKMHDVEKSVPVHGSVAV